MTPQVPWCSEEALEMHEEPCAVPGELSDNPPVTRYLQPGAVGHTLGWGRTESCISETQVGEGDRAATSLPHPAPWCRQSVVEVGTGVLNTEE